jgi:hypothetical protein
MSIRMLVALVPVAALAVACGGEAVPEPQTPEAGQAATTEEKPAEPAPAADGAAPAAGAATPAPTGEAPPAGAEKAPDAK